jgi:hypothetical protein
MFSNHVAKIVVSGNNSFSGVQHTRQVSDLLRDRHRLQIARQQIANVLGFGLLQRFCRAPQSFSLFLGQTNRQRGSTHSLGVYTAYDILQDTVISIPGQAILRRGIAYGPPLVAPEYLPYLATRSFETIRIPGDFIIPARILEKQN